MKHQKFTHFFPFLSGAFVARLSALLMFACLLAAPLSAQNTKPKVSVQGTLKSANGTTVDDGQYDVTFNLYDVATGGTVLWFENASIEVIGGIYSYYLGTTKDLVPANFAKTLYLGIKIGSYELVPRSELSYAPYAFSVTSAQTVLCSGAVGDVKYSILNPTDFAKENGTCWVPMDGRSLANSKLAQYTGSYNEPNLPNAGGFFLRAQEFSNTDQDPDRTDTSPIAFGQGDSFRQHSHTMQSAGAHTHGYKDENICDICSTGTNQDHADGDNTWEEDTSRTTSSAGAHTHTIDPTGGAENRPKNLNFWIYIRIN